MNGSWVNLHQHTIHSMLDGLSKHELLAKRAAELGMPALAITDHGNIMGWLDFYDACVEAGVKPILGLEAYQARKTRFDQDEEERTSGKSDNFDQRGPYHLTVLARNLTGYRNLIKLSSRAFLEGFYGKPRVDHDLLAEHADGLIIVSGCLNGEVQQALQRGDVDAARNAAGFFQDIVGKDNFYVELQDHGIKKQAAIRQATIDLADYAGAKVVATGDCHYVSKEESHTHDVMLCISTGSTFAQPPSWNWEDDDPAKPSNARFSFKPGEFHLKSYEEMRERFPEEYLQNTLAVAESIELELKFGELYFPEFDVPGGESVDTYLERQVRAGITRRYGSNPGEEVEKRLEHELAVVKRMGFQSYFLVVWDLVSWARSKNIRVGWGRGSAAGSILSYALGITGLEPLKFGLLFERFLVEGRKSMPDIDLDFDDRYRDQVIQYARDKYGDERVAHIVTFTTIGARLAIRDAARVTNKEFSFGDKLAKMVPEPVLGVAKTITEALDTSDLGRAYKEDPDAKEVIDAALGLEGVIRQTGIHAAGVVISKSPTTDFVPVMLAGKDKNIVVTQWDMERVEQCGQLKIDFLGLRNLGVIDMTLRTLHEAMKRADIEVDDIPVDDPLTYRELCAGNSMGVFQLESPGMREKMLAIQPDRLEDIMALISLYRPGPLGSGMDKTYVARKHGRQAIEYDHPKLKDVLESSYGIMLYQEDVLAVARHLAGFSPGEADDLRKAIGKKQMDKIGKFRDDFVKGCRETSDVDPAIADKIYSDIKYFGGYGFNRAHAASYAMVSYVTAYLKFNYPAEYMAGLLTSVKHNAPYLNECRRLGITVHPPSINKSELNFRVLADDEILFGLNSISGIGVATANAAINSRTEEEYRNIYDFMRRSSTAILNKRVVEHLAWAGALDELAPDLPERKISREEKKHLLDVEKQELGLYVSDHPLLGVAHMMEPHINSSVLNLEIKGQGDIVTVGGLITMVTPRITKAGAKMFTLFMEDLTGPVEIVVFPKDAAKHMDSFHEGDIVIITGRVTKDGDDEHPVSKIIFQELKSFEMPEEGVDEPIVLRFMGPPSHGIINKIESLVVHNPGDSPIYIEFQQGRHIITTRLGRNTSLEMQEALQLLTLEERVDVI